MKTQGLVSWLSVKDDAGLVSKKTQSLCKRRQRPSVKVDTDVVRKKT